MPSSPQSELESEAGIDGRAEDISEILTDERSRAIVQALVENEGELHISELVDEVIERERNGFDGGGDDLSVGWRSIPPWAFSLVSLGGITTVLGSHFEIGHFVVLSIEAWASVFFGLLVALHVYSTARS
ncbi:hypothetical protein [Halegenticoccus soli]|uniref:hypothetical protein n=1 Tax=Halegenticoccus soli TaxID=1985678 RepID=UPI000C6E58E9|nr:hypothetical protein [Halegenticoccus soli]